MEFSSGVKGPISVFAPEWSTFFLPVNVSVSPQKIAHTDGARQVEVSRVGRVNTKAECVATVFLARGRSINQHRVFFLHVGKFD